MPDYKDVKDAKADAKNAKDELAKEVLDAVVENPLELPGYHVVSEDNKFLGTYESREDAKCFIEQQLYPQDLKGQVVCGPGTPEGDERIENAPVVEPLDK